MDARRYAYCVFHNPVVHVGAWVAESIMPYDNRVLVCCFCVDGIYLCDVYTLGVYWEYLLYCESNFGLPDDMEGFVFLTFTCMYVQMIK